MMKQIIKTLLILCLLIVTSAMWACVNETTGNVLIDGSTEGLEFELIENANEYAVVGYEGTSEEVVVASTYQGLPVTKIAATAFLNASVTSLSLPDTINLIEAEALANLDLTEFLVPSGLYYLAQAFGENRENIDFKVAKDHPYLKEVSMAGRSVIVSKDEKTVLLVENQSLWRRTLKLAGSYEEIAPYAFSYTDYKEIVIPASVTKIGAYAFSHVDTETITINANTTSIGEYMFYDASCEKIQLSDSIEEICEGAFLNTPNAIINFPANIKTIGDWAFANSGFSGELVLPEGLETIGDAAFNANAITSIVIPSTVTSMSTYLFANDGAVTHRNYVTRITFVSDNFIFSEDTFKLFLIQNYMNQGYGLDCDYKLTGSEVVVTIVLPNDPQEASYVERAFDYYWTEDKPVYDERVTGDYFFTFTEHWLVFEYNGE